MQFRISLLLAALFSSLAITAQQAAPPKATPQPPLRPLQPLVEKQFGAGFKLDSHFAPLYGDFDGDGNEDIALIAISKNPLGASGGFNYKVSDPYDTYFGIGDPKITTAYATFSDGSGHCILIIHSWKAEAPKAKWVIVNVPFDKVAAGQVTVRRKKTVDAVATIETNGMSSMVFFDGRKYRWEPNDFADDAQN
jgi:hypothetical protein